MLSAIEIIYIPAIVVTILVIIFNLRLVFFTCLYFHTRLENLMGLFISISTVIVILMFYFEHWLQFIYPGK